MAFSALFVRRATVLNLTRVVSGTSQNRFHMDHLFPQKNGTSNDQSPKINDRPETQVDPKPLPIPTSAYDRTRWNMPTWLTQLLGGTILVTGLALVIGGTCLLVDNAIMLKTLDNTISRGNYAVDPEETVAGICINRDDVVKKIKESIILKPNGIPNGFGVILGPTGTGKTYLIKKACLEAKGVLYFEVILPYIFPRKLAKAIGMRTVPGIMSGLLRKYFPNSAVYHALPDDRVECLEYVIDVLAERAAVYLKKHGHRVTLFIDGADVLAKDDPKVFTKLVDIAKGLGNMRGLQIIFGCSEGSIMPLIDQTSSKTRCEVMEIPDLSIEQAIDYLKKSGLSSKLAEGVIEATGTRMIFLVRAIRFHDLYKSEYKSEDDLLNTIIEEMTNLFTAMGLHAVVRQKPESIVILKHLLGKDSKTGFDPLDFFIEFEGSQNEAAVRRCVQSLIQSNTLRYTSKGNITWHSRLVEEKVKEKFNKDLFL